MILSRCERVLRILIRRAFPELRGTKIALQFGDFDSWMYYQPAAPASFILGVDNSLREAPRRVLEGGFAHELAHIACDRRRSRWQLDFAFARYRVSISWRIREERRTDLEVIRRGYGRHLLSLMLYARAHGYTSCREHGLLIAEVRRRIGSPW